jgi:voltage-gated potassium channel
MISKNKYSRLQERIQFYLIDCKTLPGKLIDIFIILLNLLVCFIFVYDTYTISEKTRSTLWTIEVITVILFSIEYLARLYGARNKKKYIFNIYSMIDLLAILPTIPFLFLPTSAVNYGFIRIIRVFKVLRIFRFLRFTQDPYFFFGNISMAMLNVVRLLLTLLMIFFVSSGFFWHFENQVNPHVNTFGDAFYFTVVALTTVGFGDIIPVTQAGKWVTVLMILSGIILIPWQASRLVKEWIHLSDKQKVVCSKCGLKYHDKDASHCKACGNLIYQEFDGD